jgi:Fe-S cluster assembly ATP-binding protein
MSDKEKQVSDDAILEIRGLHATVEGKAILNGIDLTLHPGEVHAIMGPNGSGKSTLAYVLTGRDGYEVTQGEILYRGKDLCEMSPEERAGEGVFLAFQYPVEIPGVPTTTFLKEALNSIRKYRGEDELDALQFVKLLRAKTKELGIGDEMLKRAVNVGFSGGEKKRNEALQMAVLDPALAVLDETDSGLDIDALKTVADGVNSLRSETNAFLVITHYQRLLTYIVPDHVHVLARGKIVRSGGKELALELEEKGYADYLGAAA